MSKVEIIRAMDYLGRNVEAIYRTLCSISQCAQAADRNPMAPIRRRRKHVTQTMHDTPIPLVVQFQFVSHNLISPCCLFAYLPRLRLSFWRTASHSA